MTCEFDDNHGVIFEELLKTIVKYHKNFEKCEINFDLINERLDKLDEKINKLDENINKLDEKINKLDENIKYWSVGNNELYFTMKECEANKNIINIDVVEINRILNDND